MIGSNDYNRLVQALILIISFVVAQMKVKKINTKNGKHLKGAPHLISQIINGNTPK